jgi:hypothetical protein
VACAAEPRRKAFVGLALDAFLPMRIDATRGAIDLHQRGPGFSAIRATQQLAMQPLRNPTPVQFVNSLNHGRLMLARNAKPDEQ